jgi:hypothetical protein
MIHVGAAFAFIAAVLSAAGAVADVRARRRTGRPMPPLAWVKVGIAPMMIASAATGAAAHSLEELGVLAYDPRLMWAGAGWGAFLGLVGIVFAVIGVRNHMRELTRPPRRDPDPDSGPV